MHLELLVSPYLSATRSVACVHVHWVLVFFSYSVEILCKPLRGDQCILVGCWKTEGRGCPLSFCWDSWMCWVVQRGMLLPLQSSTWICTFCAFITVGVGFSNAVLSLISVLIPRFSEAVRNSECLHMFLLDFLTAPSLTTLNSVLPLLFPAMTALSSPYVPHNQFPDLILVSSYSFFLTFAFLSRNVNKLFIQDKYIQKISCSASPYSEILIWATELVPFYMEKNLFSILKKQNQQWWYHLMKST